ncbi:hypothetical protein HDU67_001765 [Dinochytrium kinnereticum]|nr:hypothetical protein HDU67_001765 [Dinochytrium kinnereticum]
MMSPMTAAQVSLVPARPMSLPEGRMITRRMVKAAAEAAATSLVTPVDVGAPTVAPSAEVIIRVDTEAVDVTRGEAILAIKTEEMTSRKRERSENAGAGGGKRVKMVASRSTKDSGTPPPAFSEELARYIDQCKVVDATHKITWDKSPTEITASQPGYDRLKSDEVHACATLRLTPSQYLWIKQTLVKARMEKGSFSKREAQSLFSVDVNKTGRLFDWFIAKGWLAPYVSTGRSGRK